MSGIRRCACCTATVRQGMSRIGGRNSKARCRRPGSMCRRCRKARGRSAPRNPKPDHKFNFMSEKTIHSVGIIMNGVTGRMGLNQHLRRSIYAIMKQGGVKLSDSETIMPRPVLVGRNPAKLEAISAECGGIRWTTDLAAELANPENSIYFDSQTTDRRATDVKKAIAAGKNIYCEKPVSDSLDVAMELLALAEKAG